MSATYTLKEHRNSYADARRGSHRCRASRRRGRSHKVCMPSCCSFMASGAICLFIGMGIWLFGITVIARAERSKSRCAVDLLADILERRSGQCPAGDRSGRHDDLDLMGVPDRLDCGHPRQPGHHRADWDVIIVQRCAPSPHWRRLPVRPAANQISPSAFVIGFPVWRFTQPIALLSGIVFLMTTKPTLTSAIGAILDLREVTRPGLPNTALVRAAGVQL